MMQESYPHPAPTPSRLSYIAPRCLFPLDSLKKSANIAPAEPSRALTLDDFKKECWAIVTRTSKHLQEAPPLIKIDEYPQVSQCSKTSFQTPDSSLEFGVVRCWNTKEFDTAVAQSAYGVSDIICMKS